MFGNFLVSDEYGFFIPEFDRLGRLLRRIPVPEKFVLDRKTGHPSGHVDSNGTSLSSCRPR